MCHFVQCSHTVQFTWLFTIFAVCFVHSIFVSSDDDIIFINTLPCQSAWPNAQNCVEIDLSIKLKLKSTMKSATNQTMEVDTYMMKHEDLARMWLEFGRKELSDNGYQVCMYVRMCVQLSSIEFISFIIWGIFGAKYAKAIIYLGYSEFDGDLCISVGSCIDLENGYVTWLSSNVLGWKCRRWKANL